VIAAKRLDVAFARIGVMVDAMKDVQCGASLDGA